MRQLMFWICCLGVVLILAGCRSSTNQPVDNSAITTEVGTSSSFPDFLVGTWETERYKWKLTFEPDGTVSTIGHQYVTVPIEVAEGGVYEPLRHNSYGYYVLGPCDVEYKPELRELTVTIIIDNFHIETPVVTFGGKLYDQFVGTISEDGRTWSGVWNSRPEMPDIAPTDPNDIETKPITFQKVE